MLETLVRPPLREPLQDAVPKNGTPTKESLMKSSKFELIVAERGGRYAEFQILQGQRYNGIQGRILSISSLIV